MTIFEMLEQSGVLTLLGLGIVFSFLLLLIIVISQAGKIITFLDAGKNSGISAGSDQSVKPAAQNTAAVNKDNARVTAAITAAVTKYKESH